MKKILIAVDDGPTCEMLATEGNKLAESLNAEIALLSVVDTTFLITEGSITPRKQTMTFVQEGKPYKEILNTAKDWSAGAMLNKGTNKIVKTSVAWNSGCGYSLLRLLTLTFCCSNCPPILCYCRGTTKVTRSLSQDNF
jgi:hypothetical protein